ncbi:MAG: ATP-binding cassette domain-containing protein [Oscillospiraceae bacterium]|jgi:multidrug/hemolysin transport system ATP-binding protein|nr:ATP-binding cassette domain-containing protein [Oscillospiraceae bacterium]
MAIIEVSQLQKYYGEIKAVDGISFSVNEGELFGFLGVNGAGKTTTINILSTLLSKTGGSVTVAGHELGRERDDALIRRDIGIVYQQNCLDDILTVEENLLLRGYLFEQSRSKNRQKLTEVCEILSLGDLLGRRYGKLSGGQKRRCEIAAALMHTPKLLFLDEPTTGLDPATRLSVQNAVGKLREEMGMTVFLTTHYMEEAANADNIVIIDEGKVAAAGTPHELKERYTNDTLRLYSHEVERLIPMLDGCRITKTAADCTEIEIKGTLSALPILNSVQHLITGYEVINGNMDSVFLNVTGKTLSI